MFKTIVLATDLSPAWDEIVACAGEFKALGCSQVILTYVISVKFMMGMEGKLKAEAGPKLEAQKAILEAQGLKVAIEVPIGLPAYSLNEAARCGGADLIVVGSHGLRHLRPLAPHRIPGAPPQCESRSRQGRRHLPPPGH